MHILGVINDGVLNTRVGRAIAMILVAVVKLILVLQLRAGRLIMGTIVRAYTGGASGFTTFCIAILQHFGEVL